MCFQCDRLGCRIFKSVYMSGLFCISNSSYGLAHRGYMKYTQCETLKGVYQKR